MDANTREADGFTLIELLVVILVIGVLAAIAMPSLMHHRESAFKAAMSSDLHGAVTAELAYSSSNGSFTTVPAELASEGYRATSGVTPVHVRLVGASFLACVKHAAVPEWLVYDGATGAMTRSSSDCV